MTTCLVAFVCFVVNHKGHQDHKAFHSTFNARHPGESRYRIHTSLARYVWARQRPYTSRPRSGEREGPIAKQWEGEGRPCYLFLRRAAEPDCRHFHAPPFSPAERCTKGPGAPHPPNAGALGPSLSPLSRGEVYRRSPNSPAKICACDSGGGRDPSIHAVGLSETPVPGQPWVPAFAGMTGEEREER